MKILLYFENEKFIRKSGIGRALEHQKKALSLNGIEFTLNKHDKYDLAHINTYYKKSRNLIKKCKKNNIPVIVHGHSTKEDFRNSFAFWKLIKPIIYRSLEKCYSLPDEIITPTSYSKKLIESYTFVKCPVINISNGVDVNKYDIKVSKDEELKLRHEFNIGDNQKIVLGIGWMFERKGFHDFIEIAKSFSDVTFIWFGAKNKLMNTKKINKAINHKPNNVILPGYKPQDTIIKMLHISNCFLFPSYEETEGIVLLEAMASKCPLIIRDIGAFDYLKDGIDSLKANNNKEFINKINIALNNDLEDIKNNAYNLAKMRDLEIIGKKLKIEYEKLLNKN